MKRVSTKRRTKRVFFFLFFSSDGKREIITRRSKSGHLEELDWSFWKDYDCYYVVRDIMYEFRIVSSSRVFVVYVYRSISKEFWSWDSWQILWIFVFKGKDFRFRNFEIWCSMFSSLNSNPFSFSFLFVLKILVSREK